MTAPKKTRKIQSSKYIPKDDTQEVLDVIATATDADIAAVCAKPNLNRFEEALPKVSVKLGYGIVEVLQLDDVRNAKDLGLEIDFSKKSFIAVTATRSALAYLADCCQNRVSNQYDQPLWYMSSAKASVEAINKALGQKAVAKVVKSQQGLRSFHVSGIIQVTVKARTAKEAVEKALRTQDSLMTRESLNISLDNISDAKSHTTVDFDHADELDAE